MTVLAVEEAVSAGATAAAACGSVGVSTRTLARWRDTPDIGDMRRGPLERPGNALSDVERARVLQIANSAEYRDQSPKQIVPKLADAGQYVASESTFYRVLEAEGLLAHRGKAKAPQPRPLATHEATGPNQLWSWDITYLRANIRGKGLIKIKLIKSGHDALGRMV